MIGRAELFMYRNIYGSAAEQNRRRHERVRLMLDSAPMIIDCWNSDYELIDCNSYAVEFYGFDSKEAYLSSELPPYPDHKNSWDNCKRLLATAFRDGYAKSDFTEYKLNGDAARLEVECFRMKDPVSDGYIVLAYSKDVTELRASHRAMERTLKELEQRERLLAAGNRAAQVLLMASNSSSADAQRDELSIMEGISIMGNLLEADRTQIWTYQNDDEPYAVLQYEWTSEFAKQKKQYPEGASHSYSETPKLAAALLAGECFNGPVSELNGIGEYHAEHGAVSAAILPLFMQGELIALFSVQDCRKVRVFSKNEMDILASVGMMFVSIFSQSRYRNLAYTDTLTGIYNRRYFTEYCGRELEKSGEFSIIMADIDLFKLVNDNYGHSIGDEVLKIFAARLRNMLRRDTPLARYGGEEFVIALSGTKHESAMQIAWRLNRVIGALPFRVGDLVLKITASFGVASKAGGSEELSEIIERADKALYRAKESGRNTVIGE